MLIARAWYKGNDYGKVEDAFTYMIETRPTAEHPEYYSIVSVGIELIDRTIGR